MFSFRSVLNYFATAFTFSIGGGIMESALISAAIGGGTSLVTGQDPLKGALLGAVTGGAMSGIGSALGAAGSAAGTTAATGANSALQTGAGLTSSIPGTTGASMFTEALPQVATAVPESLGGMSNVGINTLAQPVTEQLATQIPQAAAPATQGGIRDMLGLKPDSMASKGLDWWNKQDTLSQAGIGGIGLMGANALLSPPNALPEEEEYDSPLAGYDRNSFTPDTARPQMPYYKASYAEGGIAGLQNQQGGMYPQSQQANTQYATPSQMPTSSEVVNSGYEPQTNAYTGEPVGFAEGGTAGFMGGQQSYQGMGGMQNANGGMGSLFNMMRDIQAANAPSNSARFDPAVFQRGQAAQQAQRAPADSHIYRPKYAEGGIAGYSLGGYAHGGNPRLLKGPGTGLSDDIPATIGHKQPARLAAGEFVVSSDVVSNLGGGSTDAGAKMLYDMMDRVRKQAHGTKKQIKPVNERKALPA